MTLSHGPSVVTRGLFFMVDPANPQSYAGSGTVYNDISRVANQVGTLTNGVTYSSNNMGYLGFNGSTQYVTFGTSLTQLDATDKTMLMWVNPTAWSNDPSGLLDKGNDNNQGYGFWMQNGGKLWFWPSSFQDIKDTGSLSAPVGRWSHVAITWNQAGKTAGFYYNGRLGSSVTNASANPGGSSASMQLVLGSIRNGSSPYFYNGLMGPVMLYNRVLTQDEILQNFNAHRGRYGV